MLVLVGPGLAVFFGAGVMAVAVCVAALAVNDGAIVAEIAVSEGAITGCVAAMAVSGSEIAVCAGGGRVNYML